MVIYIFNPNFLVLYWRFDEGKDFELVDLSNIENNGEIIFKNEKDNSNDLWLPLEDG